VGIKRDDLTGAALSGNKVQCLAFFVLPPSQTEKGAEKQTEKEAE
jgi:1-aminocyclopropane-1-carboxylate deaminase/D-cysteine desulfhydrase-like pyridoxal-dependent ACC family enzyme